MIGYLFSYSLFTAIILAVLYLCYKWALADENQHWFNRIALWGIYTISLCSLPVLVLMSKLANTLSQTSTIGIELGDVSMVSGMIELADPEQPLYLSIILMVYLIGVIAITVHTVWIAVRLCRLISRGERREIDGYTLVLLSDDSGVAPFSWCRYVVMSRKDWEECRKIIVTHELQHLRLGHWVDLLLAQVVGILQWFNPAAWLMREELKTVHEYQADEAVLATGTDAKEYQMLLIKKAVGARFPSLANSLNHSKLKKRITMMYNSKTSRIRRMRGLALVPACAMALFITDIPAVADVIHTFRVSEIIFDKGNEFSSDVQPVVVENEEFEVDATEVESITVEDAAVAMNSESNTAVAGNQVNYDDKVFTVVEKKPEFPGGERALYDHIIRNLRYPKAAEEKNIQGRVVTQFVVKSDGSIGDVKIVKGVDKDIDAEAIRLIKSLPNFTPGTYKGKPVNVQYTLPLNFALAVDKETDPQPAASSSKVAASTPANQVATDDKVFSTVERKPEFPGGEIALMKYISQNIHYPKSAQEKNIQGRVVAQFVVKSDGSIGDVKIVRGVDSDIDAEAVRVIKSLPNFTPGQVDGRPVSVWYTLPLLFKYSDDKKASETNATSQVRQDINSPVNDVEYFINGEKTDKETLLALSPNTVRSIDIRKGPNRVDVITK